MASPWEAEPVEEMWGDRDAWRGDSYPDIAESWIEEEPAAPERPVEDRFASPGVEAWPEELAGPEYWMYKNMGHQPPG
jgi:hypothetical protein